MLQLTGGSSTSQSCTVRPKFDCDRIRLRWNEKFCKEYLPLHFIYFLGFVGESLSCALKKLESQMKVVKVLEKLRFVFVLIFQMITPLFTVLHFLRQLRLRHTSEKSLEQNEDNISFYNEWSFELHYSLKWWNIIEKDYF